MPDPTNLDRFVAAQRGTYDVALGELRRGRKQSHWVWYILPQLRGLGSSGNSHFYGISDMAEARAYLAHDVLGPRLKDCIRALCQHRGMDATTILGPVDAAKLRSCLTLFEVSAPHDSLFTEALVQFYAGQRCPRTLELLRAGID